jgi:uncharacterized protein
MRRWRLVPVAFASLMATGCLGGSSGPLPDRPPSTVTFDASGAVLYVDVADTTAERRRGLMGVRDLPEDEGMAFVYAEPVSGTFWMKDTLIPLSIAFVDERGRVIAIRDMEPCDADPCPHYEAGAPYVLAVEANRGWFDEHGVDVGEPAELEQQAHG